MTWTTTYEAFLQPLNEKVLKKYLATEHDKPEDDSVPKFGEEYFDVAVANILLKGASPAFPVSANMAEMITRMAYEGLRHHNILGCDHYRQDFCSAFALNTLPDQALLYDYYIWLDAHPDESDMTYWVYCTLLLFAFLKRGIYDGIPYRSRLMVGFVHAFEFCAANGREADRFRNDLRIREKIGRIFRTVLRDVQVVENGNFADYMADMLREFGILLFATILGRGSEHEELMKLGKNVHCRFLLHHQRIVDGHYERRNNQGEHYETT